MRSIVIAAILAGSSASLLAQSAPIKMGLWEKTINTSGAGGVPATIKDTSCITPEAWQRMTANMLKPHDGCKMNTAKTANGYTFNGTCNILQGPQITITGSETIQDSEHIVTESHSTNTTNGKTEKIDIHSTSRFLSSNCGSVKPDDPDGE